MDFLLFLSSFSWCDRFFFPFLFRSIHDWIHLILIYCIVVPNEQRRVQHHSFIHLFFLLVLLRMCERKINKYNQPINYEASKQ